jgi:hypothetical protein
VRTRLESLENPEDWGEEAWDELGLGSVLRDSLHEDLVDAEADDESFDDALDSVLDEMSAAEGLSFTSALRQIQSGAGQVVSNPTFGQITRTALPLGAGAVGTVIGGPAGTAIGSRLGTAAAGALARPAGASRVPAASALRPPIPMPTPATVPAGPAAGDPGVLSGSAAAAQGLVLTQQPDVLKALLALSMGQQGARQVGGVPVSSVMNLLSSVFGQAAADADELAFLDGEDGRTDFGEGDPSGAEPELAVGRALYTAFMVAENDWVA